MDFVQNTWRICNIYREKTSAICIVPPDRVLGAEGVILDALRHRGGKAQQKFRKYDAVDCPVSNMEMDGNGWEWMEMDGNGTSPHEWAHVNKTL